MESHLIFVFIFMLLSVFESSWTYTIEFKRPCRDLSPECLKSSLQAAIPFFAKGAPDLGMEPLDPYVMDQLNLTLSGITMYFYRGNARGLRTCVVDYARFVDNTLESQIHCNLLIRGKYRSSGSLLVFPIDGDGMSSIKCDNLKLHTIMKLGTKVKKGQSYLDIVSSTTKHVYDGRVSYFMTNLIKDSPQISEAVLKFMNNNWLLVAEEFGTPLVEFGVKSIMKNVRRFFEVVSLDVLKEL